MAKASSNSSLYATEFRQIYHTLNPHPAFVLDSKGDHLNHAAATESIYRQLLVQGTLAVLLPTEDLQNGCLRTLVSDIIADLILGKVLSERICTGNFLFDAILRVITLVTKPPREKQSIEAASMEAKSRLEEFGLLSGKDVDTEHHSFEEHQLPVSAAMWKILQIIFFLFLSLRFIITGLLQVSSLPHRLSRADHLTD